MAYKLSELRELSAEELIRQHDSSAQNTGIGLSYYREEIDRRDRNEQTEAMLGYTKWLFWLTVVVTVATVINLLIFILSLWK